MFNDETGWTPGCGCRPSRAEWCPAFLALNEAGVRGLEAVLEHWLDAKAVEAEWAPSPGLAEVGAACCHNRIRLTRFDDGTAGWVCSDCGLPREQF
jgi:hypothetical protein